MTGEKVRGMLKNQTFRPFKLVLIDGREFLVNHPEFLAVAPGDRTILHFEPGENDSYVTFIDALHVSTLEPLNGRPPRGRGKRGGRKTKGK